MNFVFISSGQVWNENSKHNNRFSIENIFGGMMLLFPTPLSPPSALQEPVSGQLQERYHKLKEKKYHHSLYRSREIVGIDIQQFNSTDTFLNC